MKNLISPTGTPGPRIDVLMRIFDRIAEFEEEVRTGKRVLKDPLPADKDKPKSSQPITEE